MRVSSYVILTLLVIPSVFLIGAGERPGEPTTPEAVDQRLEGGNILLTISGFDYSNPTVAYSTKHGQYLAVFERNDGNGNIVGQFVDAATGSLIGSNFLIASTTEREANPDVIYHPFSDNFMVVYAKGNTGSRDIFARVVHGSYQTSGSQLTPVPVTAIANTTTDEYSPAVAVNEDNGHFIVVYNHGDGAIYGRMFFKLGDFISILGSTGINIYNKIATTYTSPDVTWGSGGNTFLVVFHDEIPSFPSYVIARYLHDEYQFFGSQIIGLYCPLAPYNSGPDPLTYDCTYPSVAYDPSKDMYLIVFQHQEGESDFDPGTIHGQYVTSEYGTNCAVSLGGRAFAIETTPGGSHWTYFSAQVAYSGIGDFFYVTYLRQDGWTEPYYYFAFLRMITFGGSNRIVTPRIEVREVPVNKYILHPGLAGSPMGRTLVVWGEQYAVTNSAIRGQRVIPYRSFLPVVFRNY